MTHHAIVLFVALCGVQPSPADLPLQPGTVIRFATVEKGKTLLTARDGFVAALSPFDRSGRLMTDRTVSEDEYLRHVGRQVLAWEGTEIEKFSAIVASLRTKLMPWNLPLPDTILLVKTTGREEGGAAYTRANGIVLPLRYVERSRARLEATLLHELFHVLSRSNPALRRTLYETIGFRPCGDIELPESLKSRKITNPDSVGGDYAIRVTRDGTSYDVTPVLLSSTKRNAAGRSFFGSMIFRLMAVEQEDDRWAPKLVDGKPLLFEHAEVHGFYEQIGRNTQYVIHPEEILAENFVLLVNQQRDVPTPRVLHEMAELLRKP